MIKIRIRIRKKSPWVALLLLVAAIVSAGAQLNEPISTNVFSHPLSRGEAVEQALRQNSAILKGKADLRASYGIEIQLRSVALPQFTGSGAYNAEAQSLIESFPLPEPYSSFIHFPTQNWNADVQGAAIHLPGRASHFRISLGQIDAPTGVAELSNGAR